MKRSHIPVVLTLALLISTVSLMPADAQAVFPRLTSVTPDTGSVGDELNVEGENLGKDLVKALYLTDGQIDWKADILEQTSTGIRFKIPAKATPGRFNLMVLTSGKEPRLIEQPIKVTVE